MSSLNALRDETTAWAKRKGWHDSPRSPGDLLMLAVSELAEALEEYRAGRALDEVYEVEDKFGQMKPEGVPIELADTIIRIADMAGRWGIDLDAAIEQKMMFNENRPYKHGGKGL